MQAVNSTGWFAELLAQHEAPCVSMYFPAHRASPPAEQNLQRFRELLSQAERMLMEKFPNKQAKAGLAKLHTIPAEQIGAGPHDGIAIFASPDYLQVLDLQRPVDELCVVSESFHVKPLIRTMQQGDRFQILCLSLNRIRILEGNQYAVSEVPLRNVPPSILEARVVHIGGKNMPEQHGATSAEQPAMRLDHFLRLLDTLVWENHSRVSHLPLIVAADVKNLSAFLEMSKNPYILEKGIAIDPEHQPNDRLRDEAWKLMEPRYQEEVRRLTDQFRVAQAHQKGTDELPIVAEAAAVGRVGTLLVDANRYVPGVLHKTSGTIESATSHDPRAEDLLDDLAEMVLKMDGQVYVLEHEQMPTDAGIAAVFRY